MKAGMKPLKTEIHNPQLSKPQNESNRIKDATLPLMLLLTLIQIFHLEMVKNKLNCHQRQISDKAMEIYIQRLITYSHSQVMLYKALKELQKAVFLKMKKITSEDCKNQESSKYI